MIDLAGAAGSRYARASARALRLLGLGRARTFRAAAEPPINTLPFRRQPADIGSGALCAHRRDHRGGAGARASARRRSRWVDAAFRTMREFADPNYAGRLRQPLLLVAAGQDRIVSTPAIGAFAARLRAGSHLVIPGARHEILMEQDRYREQFWAAFDAFVPGTPLF